MFYKKQTFKKFSKLEIEENIYLLTMFAIVRS